ncbi:MAG TPA: tetratricopeptide repeat protein [Burkholderiales bacterium]|jgi:tetratricopeptide (TPR) repeat protein|nr:tetratricopeptide repeat protein [Burkholderiales bacterium]
MSVINKALQDLNARNAAPEAVGGLEVHAVPEPPRSHEGFWRVMVVLMLVAIGGVAYLAYALRPRTPIATELAQQYVAKGVIRQERPVKPPAAQSAPESAIASQAQPSGPLKLARSIETPVPEEQRGTIQGDPPALARAPSVPLSTAEQARLHQQLGSVLAALSRHEEAIAAYQISLEKTPQNGGCWLALATSLEAVGRPKEAADAYRRAIDTGSLEGKEKTLAARRAAELR